MLIYRITSDCHHWVLLQPLQINHRGSHWKNEGKHSALTIGFVKASCNSQSSPFPELCVLVEATNNQLNKKTKSYICFFNCWQLGLSKACRTLVSKLYHCYTECHHGVMIYNCITPKMIFSTRALVLMWLIKRQKAICCSNCTTLVRCYSLRWKNNNN